MIKLQTYVGSLLSQLTQAGQIIEIPLVDERGISRLRSATKQVATRTGIGVSLRTIENRLYAMRTDFPPPPMLMPGLETQITDVDHAIATLQAMTPWPDDPSHDRKKAAIATAVKVLRDGTV